MATAIAAAGPGAGPAEWSATHFLGLTTQVPAVAAVAVVGRGPKGLAGVRFTSRSNLKRCGLPPIQIAVLETLRNYPAYTELAWPDIAERLRQLAREGRIDLSALVRVAERENRPGLRERLAELNTP